MVPPTETITRPRQLAIETELFSFRFNARLAFFWVLRRTLLATRFLLRAIGFVFSVVFGRYEMVRQVGPGMAPEQIRRDQVF